MQIFFHENEKIEEDLFAAIASACTGLAYVSETDAPVTAIRLAAQTTTDTAAILCEMGISEMEYVESAEFQEFFQKLTTHMDWFDEIHRERAAGFLRLKTLLEENLTDLRVLRIGRVRIEILVLGSDKNGRLLGIKTAAVET